MCINSILRETLKKLIVYVNKEKDELKRNGITVDGIKHTVNFKGIQLCLLESNKKYDENWKCILWKKN